MELIEAAGNFLEEAQKIAFYPPPNHFCTMGVTAFLDSSLVFLMSCMRVPGVPALQRTSGLEFGQFLSDLGKNIGDFDEAQ